MTAQEDSSSDLISGYLRRNLHYENSENGDVEFDPLLFWGINILLMVLLILLCVCGWRYEFFRFAHYSTAGRQVPSDIIYQQNVLARRRAREESRRETPVRRKRKLLFAFGQTNVQMTVQETDLMDEISIHSHLTTTRKQDANPAVNIPTGSMVSTQDGSLLQTTTNNDTTTSGNEKIPVDDEASLRNNPVLETDMVVVPVVVDDTNQLDVDGSSIQQQHDDDEDVESGSSLADNNNSSESNDDDEVEEIDLAVEECDTGYLMLPCHRQAPNCCAVCLSPYEVGEQVVWSQKCKHAFHQECILDWFTTMRDGTPCPTCRQEFVDLRAIEKEKAITWAPTKSFDLRAVGFR